MTTTAGRPSPDESTRAIPGPQCFPSFSERSSSESSRARIAGRFAKTSSLALVCARGGEI
ncbi:hypothetical protein L1049_001197 [Liquidambar formosana]|uniref:Uncharacterized protein n=1 Tax=Liquidambar formosana TaxID=63359 RepID=A0AAP0NDU6_LIQFO